MNKLTTSQLDFQDIDIQDKKNYLIWREKNNFFYAISHENDQTKLSMWSMITGELIQEKILTETSKIDRLKNH